MGTDFCHGLLGKLGGRQDDYHNFFTARMLMLLESAPLVHESQYSKMLGAVVDAYFRDYPDHSGNFRPVFLINDILRFWKTLCLNYEHRRNRPDDDIQRKRIQQVKNFKLKFSRMMTCFGTIVAVCASETAAEREAILQLAKLNPFDRFMKASESVDELNEVREAIIEDYLWFLERTALTTEDLRSRFEKSAAKREMFRRAEQFGNRTYEVLQFFAKRNNYDRYLVV